MILSLYFHTFEEKKLNIKPNTSAYNYIICICVAENIN